MREAVAAGIIRVGKEDTMTNIADVFTKLVPFSRKFSLSMGSLALDNLIGHNILTNCGDRLIPVSTITHSRITHSTITTK
jgi:hypothetical protein